MSSITVPPAGNAAIGSPGESRGTGSVNAHHAADAWGHIKKETEAAKSKVKEELTDLPAGFKRARTLPKVDHGPTPKASNIRIKAHVCEKTFVVSCGGAGQQIRWLANLVVTRYDANTNGMELGSPLGVHLEDGTELNMDGVICKRLAHGSEVWVV